MADKGIHPDKTALVQEKADNALRESEEKYRILVENTQAIIYTLTTDGVFTFVSQAWTEFLGSPTDQVIGKRIGEFIRPDDLPYCQASRKWLSRQGNPIPAKSIECIMPMAPGVGIAHAEFP